MSYPPWTYSRLESFETCPRRFFHVKVAKDVHDPPSEASKWGEEVHTAFEHKVKKDQPLPPTMETWANLATTVAQLPGQKFPEAELAVTASFTPAEWNNSWSRGKADLLVVHNYKAIVLDYKTGKRKPSEQLKLYAAYTFAHYPEVSVVETGFVWLRDRRIDKAQIHRDDAGAIWREFLPRVARLQSAYDRDSWPPKPSGLCRGWCPVTQCEFYSRKAK